MRKMRRALAFFLFVSALFFSCESMEIRTAEANEKSGSYDQSAIIYFDRIGKDGSIKDHKMFIKDCQLYIGQIDKQIDVTNKITADDKANATVLDRKIKELDDKSASLSNFLSMVTSSQSFPVNGGSDSEKATVASEYQQLGNKLNRRISRIANYRKKISDDYGSIVEIVKGKIADIVDLGRKEDYKAIGPMIEDLKKYNVMDKEIDGLTKAFDYAGKGKDFLRHNQPDDALAAYRSADKSYHTSYFFEAANSIALDLASTNYKEGTDTLNGQASDLASLIKALGYFKAAQFYKSNFRDTQNEIDTSISKIVGSYIVNAKKYEAIAQWGCAALERNQALLYDQTREDAQIDNDLEKLRKSKTLKLAIIPSSESAPDASTPDFVSFLIRGISSDALFSDGYWQLAKITANEKLLADLKKDDGDLSALAPAERDQIDLAVSVSMSSFVTDGPNKNENEMTKPVIVQYHTVSNPDHEAWRGQLDAANEELRNAQFRQAMETDANARNIDGITIIGDQTVVTVLTLKEPPAQIQVPDYADALWREIDWDETASVDGQILFSPSITKGTLIQVSKPFNMSDTEKCIEIHGQKYADKAGIVDTAKNLPLLSQVKQKVYDGALQKAEKEVLAALHEYGEKICAERLNEAIEKKSDDAVDYLLYIQTMYPQLIEKEEMQERLDSIHPGYKLINLH